MKKIIIFSFIGLLFAAACFYAYYKYKTSKDYEPAPFWQVSDEASQAEIDHSLWQQVLDDYLISDTPSGVNLVDYQGLVDEPDSLRSYVDSLSKLDPRKYNRTEQFAYWVNLYNAVTMQVVADNYPVDSILKISSGPLPSGPWDDEAVIISGQPLTLNDIEHRILRSYWKDHRIHFAVNCASIGCPNVQTQAFTSTNTESLLNAAAIEYLQHPRGLEIKDNTLVLSGIFDWYKEDFGANEQMVLATLSQYLDAQDQAKVKAWSTDISYDYDWSLNDAE